jgi:hypothetical protein
MAGGYATAAPTANRLTGARRRKVPLKHSKHACGQARKMDPAHSARPSARHGYEGHRTIILRVEVEREPARVDRDRQRQDDRSADPLPAQAKDSPVLHGGSKRPSEQLGATAKLELDEWRES